MNSTTQSTIYLKHHKECCLESNENEVIITLKQNGNQIKLTKDELEFLLNDIELNL